MTLWRLQGCGVEHHPTKLGYYIAIYVYTSVNAYAGVDAFHHVICCSEGPGSFDWTTLELGVTVPQMLLQPFIHRVVEGVTINEIRDIMLKEKWLMQWRWLTTSTPPATPPSATGGY